MRVQKLMATVNMFWERQTSDDLMYIFLVLIDSFVVEVSCLAPPWSVLNSITIIRATETQLSLYSHCLALSNFFESHLCRCCAGGDGEGVARSKPGLHRLHGLKLPLPNLRLHVHS